MRCIKLKIYANLFTHFFSHLIMYYLLFTTNQCPKCPSFKEFVKTNVKFPGKILNETDESFGKLALDFAVSSVPTFIAFEDENLQSAYLRTNDVGELYTFLNQHAH